MSVSGTPVAPPSTPLDGSAAAGIRLDLATSRPLRVPSDERGIDRWTARAVHVAQAAPVGELDMIVLDLLTCRDPWSALDSPNEDLAHIGEVLFDPNTGQLVEELASRPGSGGRLLVLDRIELRPEWQGRGIAALLAAEVLDQLRGGVRLAVCLPGPLERPADLTDDAAYATAVSRMQTVWAQLGFQHFREGVWLLDPQAAGLSDALSALRARHAL